MGSSAAIHPSEPTDMLPVGFFLVDLSTGGMVEVVVF